MKLMEIPGAKLTSSGLMNLHVYVMKDRDNVRAFQVPGFLEHPDFLSGIYGKTIRKSTTILYNGRIRVESKSQIVEIGVM